MSSMHPVYFPPADMLKTDVTRITNLLYFAPIDAHRRAGWCTEVMSGGLPSAYRADGRTYTGQGATYAARILDLVAWLDAQPA